MLNHNEVPKASDAYFSGKTIVCSSETASTEERIPDKFRGYVDKEDGYSYYYPSDWRDFDFRAHDSAFKDRYMQLHNVRVRFIPTDKTDIHDLGPLEEAVPYLVRHKFAAPNQVEKIFNMQEKTIDGKNYYTFEYGLTSPNFATTSFATIAIGNGSFWCGRPYSAYSADVPPFSFVWRQRRRASTPADSSSVPDHFPSPASLPNSSFPAKSPKTSNKIDLVGKLEFDRLAGKGKWLWTMLESAGVEACRRRCRTEANEGTAHEALFATCRRRCASTPADSSSVTDHFPSPARPSNSSFRADVPPFSTLRRRQRRASTPEDSSSVPDHFPSPASPFFSCFPARSPKFEVLGDLAGKLEKNGLVEEGKWLGTLLKSSGVEARCRRRRRVENGGTSAL
ncbi:hypothetical protein ACLB2K_071640 [Fragaria x ananassa]